MQQLVQQPVEVPAALVLQLVQLCHKTALELHAEEHWRRCGCFGEALLQVEAKSVEENYSNTLEPAMSEAHALVRAPGRGSASGHISFKMIQKDSFKGIHPAECLAWLSQQVLRGHLLADCLCALVRSDWPLICSGQSKTWVMKRGQII